MLICVQADPQLFGYMYRQGHIQVTYATPLVSIIIFLFYHFFIAFCYNLFFNWILLVDLYARKNSAMCTFWLLQIDSQGTKCRSSFATWWTRLVPFQRWGCFSKLMSCFQRAYRICCLFRCARIVLVAEDVLLVSRSPRLWQHFFVAGVCMLLSIRFRVAVVLLKETKSIGTIVR